jgi:CRISPR-associated protein Cas1
LAWRTLMVQKPARLSLSRCQLRVENDEGEYAVPVEDLVSVILESPQITLTSALLSACQEQGVSVVTCDGRHTPNGALLPFLPHSRQSRVARIQQSWSEPLKKRLWQRIVRAKISNQAACLEEAAGKEAALRLRAFAASVESGDPKNVEAQAARDYWPRLFGQDFRRGADGAVNAALDYGYAVLRASVARSQVVYGLIPVFGLHHDNELNAFNLTDDVMEALRPFADREAFAMRKEGMLPEGDGRLSPEARQRLVRLGFAPCRIDGQAGTLAAACDRMAAGLVAAVEGKDARLLPLPEPAADGER